jgi:TPR repeat protein
VADIGNDMGLFSKTPVERAQAACRRGDYSTALEIIRPLVAQQNGEAEAVLAALYHAGLGVKQDVFEALRPYSVASIHGNLDATLVLGKIYETFCIHHELTAGRTEEVARSSGHFTEKIMPEMQARALQSRRSLSQEQLHSLESWAYAIWIACNWCGATDPQSATMILYNRIKAKGNS